MTGIDVGGFRIVDILHTVYDGHTFHAVFHAGKVGEAPPDDISGDAGEMCCLSGGKRIVEIMSAGQAQFALRHGEDGGLFYNQTPAFDIGRAAGFFPFGKGIDGRRNATLGQFATKDGVVIPEDKAIGGRLIL